MDLAEDGVDERQELQEVRDRFFDFLWNYSEIVNSETQNEVNTPGSSMEEPAATFPYRDQVNRMAEGQTTNQETLIVNIQHLKWFDHDLAEQVEIEWLRFEPQMRQAVQRLVREQDPEFVKGDDQKEREFYISWDGIHCVDRLRDLRSAKVGGLISWKGTVTRTTEVRPELYLATYKCQLCGELARNVEQQFVMTTPMICSSMACGNKKGWTLVKEESQFVDWQRAKVQENADEMPPGSLPRAMDVILRQEMVEQIRPGDKAVFTGSLIVIPDMGAFSAPGERTLLQSHLPQTSAAVGRGVSGIASTGSRELHYKLAFLANNVQMNDRKNTMVDARTEADVYINDVAAELGQRTIQDLQRMRDTPDIYSKLARSIAPNVYGHEDVKKAVLLMLIGGVNKQTPEGIRLRGDINVAIVGDPSTAKSQILKFVAGFLPRAVFTGGKSSSAAGLTATVVKEADSREYAIEAGALMLADNGICCIDEFDKMDIKDQYPQAAQHFANAVQVAIHEAMEQQTISIAKAGIQATLNARAAILAAANPLGGRYDRSKPLKYNVNLPPAILSRFDLLHVMVDEVNPAVDEAIAYHILAAHRGAASKPPFTQLQLQQYIRYARAIKPKLSNAAAAGVQARVRLVEAFKVLRAGDSVPGSGTVYRITVRQLEALIRLSEALARVHHRTSVLEEDVREAQRLIKASVHSAGDGDMVMDIPDANERAEDIANLFLNDDAPADVQMEDQTAEERAADPAEHDENADENREAGRRVRRRPHGRTAFDDGMAPAAKPVQPAQPPAEKETSQVRMSRSRWTYLHNHVLACLKQAEEGMLDAAQKIEATAQTFMGLSQHDIIKWHIRHELEQGKLQGQDEVVAEIQLIQRVIHVMLSRHGTLVEMRVPERHAGEGREQYAVRKEKERVLIINPNYYME